MSNTRCTTTYLDLLKIIAEEQCRSGPIEREVISGPWNEHSFERETLFLHGQRNCQDASKKLLEQAQQCIKEFDLENSPKPKR